MIRTQGQDSLLEFLNASAALQGDIVSFAAGMPDPACINDYRFEQMMQAFVESRAALGESAAPIDLRQYGPTRGVIASHIQRYLLNDHGIEIGKERIIVTNGAQEGLTLLTLTLLDPAKDCLLVPDPCFPGAHEAARHLGIDVIAFPYDPVAFDRAALERAALAALDRGKRAGALYVNPTYGNPLGETLSDVDRQYLHEFATHHDLWIFEDDPYCLFSYEGKETLPFAGLSGNTKAFFVGSFSKSISPSLRVGFITVPGIDPALVERLSAGKSTLSLHTSQVCQAIVGGVLYDCDYSLRRRCRENARLYRRKRDELAGALTDVAMQTPGLREVRWSVPAGGFFMPLHLPRPFLKDDLIALRDEFGVLVTPMSAFSLSGAGADALRLAFSALPVERIRPGIHRLGAFLSQGE